MIQPGFIGWLDAALVLAATAATLLSLSRRLPLQNVLLAAAMIGAGGGLAELLGARSGIAALSCSFAPTACPRILNTLPWWVPLTWVILLLNSREAARALLQRWRSGPNYGFWQLGLALCFFVLLELGLQFFETQVRGYRVCNSGQPGSAGRETPALFLAAYATTALLLLVAATPALIPKKPVDGRGSV